LLLLGLSLLAFEKSFQKLTLRCSIYEREGRCDGASQRRYR
jgi:hypothetical protein